ncbi:MAG: helix-turn-helix domain-containing protein, partial [Myxococcota bacterium]
LQNLVERMVVLSDDLVLGSAEVEQCLPQSVAAPTATPKSGGELGAAVVSAEREAIVAALEKADGNRTKAARLLGISRRSLYYKLDTYGIA